jgi:hypothetical protein
MNKDVFQTPAENLKKQQFLKSVGVLNEHINKTFEHPKDIASACKSFALTPMPQPANLDAEMKSHMRRGDRMEANLRAIFLSSGASAAL